MEESECVCSMNCTGVHTHEVGPMVEEDCTIVLQEIADMKNVKPSNDQVYFPTKKDLMRVPPTPGLSDKLSGLCMEEEECGCSLRCPGHGEEEERVELDECVCSVTCSGVQTHSKDNEDNEDNRRDKDYELGIIYCP